MESQKKNEKQRKEGANGPLQKGITQGYFSLIVLIDLPSVPHVAWCGVTIQPTSRKRVRIKISNISVKQGQLNVSDRKE